MRPPPSKPAPEAWQQLEAEFSAALRAPLVLDQGRLCAPGSFGGVEHALSPPDAHARLALYHEQHFMRLFSAIHRGATRTSRAIGYFRINRLAERWLRAAPPREVDLGVLVDGFLPWLRLELAVGQDPLLASLAQPRAAVLECIDFDSAERAATLSPEVPDWAPKDATLERLAASRLVFAPSFTLLEEHFVVRTGTETSEAGVEFAPLASPRYVACVRQAGRVRMRSVEPLFGRILAGCRSAPLGLVLADLEAALAPDELAELAKNLGEFVRRAVTSGYWVGLESGSTSGT